MIDLRNREFILEAKKYNITEIGFVEAKPYNHMFDKEYKSVVVALFPYYCGMPDKSNISLYSRGKDYHIVIKEIFKNIFNGLSITDYEIFADIGPKIDVELALFAGLGVKGTNGLLINEKYGSYVFVGYALCNEEFEYSSLLNEGCMGCGMCVKSCPGKAISEDGKVSAEKCLSHITQTKGGLSSSDAQKIVKSGLVFGCDVCQKVCPHNENVCLTEIGEFSKSLVDNLYLSDLENISNKEFKLRFGDRAFSWRGKALLVRNLKYFGKLYEHNKIEG